LGATLANTLTGKWALVTGSSGGIGSAIARELAAAGCRLILHGHSHNTQAEELASKLRQQSTEAVVIPCNLSNEQQLAEFVEQVWQVGPLDILVNNAGVDVLTGTAAEWPFEKKLSALWQVDVAGTIYLSRALGGHMKDRGQGSIVNIGWNQAELGMAGDSGEFFAAVKGAVMAFSRSLAQSLAPMVRVNCVAPGWIKTKWGQTASQYWQDRAKAESLLARWGTPEDVARAVRFLAGPESSFINGQIVNVDGGFAGSADDRGWH
jgi:3-oxoacyl-[acyl-carrier protein] reductase